MHGSVWHNVMSMLRQFSSINEWAPIINGFVKLLEKVFPGEMNLQKDFANKGIRYRPLLIYYSWEEWVVWNMIHWQMATSMVSVRRQSGGLTFRVGFTESFSLLQNVRERTFVKATEAGLSIGQYSEALLCGALAGEDESLSGGDSHFLLSRWAGFELFQYADDLDKLIGLIAGGLKIRVSEGRSHPALLDIVLHFSRSYPLFAATIWPSLAKVLEPVQDFKRVTKFFYTELLQFADSLLGCYALKDASNTIDARKWVYTPSEKDHVHQSSEVTSILLRQLIALFMLRSQSKGRKKIKYVSWRIINPSDTFYERFISLLVRLDEYEEKLKESVFDWLFTNAGLDVKKSYDLCIKIRAFDLCRFLLTKKGKKGLNKYGGLEKLSEVLHCHACDITKSVITSSKAQLRANLQTIVSNESQQLHELFLVLDKLEKEHKSTADKRGIAKQAAKERQRVGMVTKKLSSLLSIRDCYTKYSDKGNAWEMLRSNVAQQQALQSERALQNWQVLRMRVKLKVLVQSAISFQKKLFILDRHAIYYTKAHAWGMLRRNVAQQRALQSDGALQNWLGLVRSLIIKRKLQALVQTAISFRKSRIVEGCCCIYDPDMSGFLLNYPRMLGPFYKTVQDLLQEYQRLGGIVMLYGDLLRNSIGFKARGQGYPSSEAAWLPSDVDLKVLFLQEKRKTVENAFHYPPEFIEISGHTYGKPNQVQVKMDKLVDITIEYLPSFECALQTLYSQPGINTRHLYYCVLSSLSEADYFVAHSQANMSNCKSYNELAMHYNINTPLLSTIPEVKEEPIRPFVLRTINLMKSFFSRCHSCHMESDITIVYKCFIKFFSNYCRIARKKQERPATCFLHEHHKGRSFLLYPVDEVINCIMSCPSLCPQDLSNIADLFYIFICHTRTKLYYNAQGYDRVNSVLDTLYQVHSHSYSLLVQKEAALNPLQLGAGVGEGGLLENR